MSSLKNQGISSVLNYINHSPFKHVYLVGMTNCLLLSLIDYLAGKSSFLNQCISFTRSRVSIMHLLSLSNQGVHLSKEGLIADDHFDVDYWETERSPELSADFPSDLATISPLPSTTLGVVAVKLQHSRCLLYDTPGICPSPYRVRLLAAMLGNQSRSLKELFPRKPLVPTVFSIHPNDSLLIGALGQLDYISPDNVII